MYFTQVSAADSILYEDYGFPLILSHMSTICHHH